MRGENMDDLYDVSEAILNNPVMSDTAKYYECVFRYGTAKDPIRKVYWEDKVYEFRKKLNGKLEYRHESD